MRKASLSRVPALLVLAGFAACRQAPPPPPPVTLVHPLPDTPCDHQPHDNIMKVTAAIAPCDQINISKGEQNFVMWHTTKSDSLTITFSGTNPFDFLKCTNQVCIAFSPNVPDGPTLYKYSILINGSQVYDPNIIINP